MIIKNVQGAKSISKDFENELQMYVKLFTVLYADDRVLLAESSEEQFGVKNQSLIHSNSHRCYTVTPIISVK